MSDKEERARAMGWVPKEDFRGEESNWVDAGTFLDRGENIMPILKERLSKFETEIADKSAKLDKVTQSLHKFAEFHKGTYKRAYDKAFQDLETQRRKAASESDLETYDALTGKIQDLESELAELREQDLQQPEEAQSPLFSKWLADNDWYLKDQDMKFYVDALGANLQAQGTFQDDASFYTELTRRAKEVFPHKFESPAKKKVASVEGTGDAVVGDLGGTKKWADLPADVQKVYTDQFSDIPNFSQEDYAKSYFEQEEE
jgi:hypothetical protein